MAPSNGLFYFFAERIYAEWHYDTASERRHVFSANNHARTAFGHATLSQIRPLATKSCLDLVGHQWIGQSETGTGSASIKLTFMINVRACDCVYVDGLASTPPLPPVVVSNL